MRSAIASGHADALALIRGVREQRGEAGPTGWRTLSSGAYGFNYLHRASTNYVGLGATVREESGAYTTFVDGDGQPLSGSAEYRLALAPPPVDAFWSLSAYDVDTRELVPNPIARYVINGQMPGLRWQPDGSLDVALAYREPASGFHNWLPIPAGRFYLVLRGDPAAQ